MESVSGAISNILRLNPLKYYIDYFRAVLIKGEIPGLQENLMCILFSFAALALGILVFRKRQDKFILYV